MSLATDLAGIVGADHVEADAWLTDASGLGGSAPLVHPFNAEEVRRTVTWAYERGLAIVAVGGRSGYSGGIVPEAGRPLVAVALDRLNRIRSFDPLLWRIEAEAGVTGIEAVIAPGKLARFGGPVRKDVAGYDLRGVLIGSDRIPPGRCPSACATTVP
jgi:FAD/FMN-containing dehydrogenase